MSVEAVSWALSVPIGGTSKVILIGLANHATAELTEARPAVGTLAKYAFCDRRTVQRTLRKLEDAGWIQRTGEHPIAGRPDRAVVVYRLTGRQIAPPFQYGATSTPERGDTTVPNGATPVTPEPSLEPSKEPSTSRDARTSAWPNGIGDDTAIPNRVLAVLREVANDHGAGLPTQKAVGHVLLAFPDRAHEAEAHAMAAWFADKSIKRVVATYRNWLKNADPANTGGTVTPMRRGGWTARDMYELGQQS